jgi:hypothetical protein
MFDPASRLDLDGLRVRLRGMDDRMLKRWGQSAAYMCSPSANLGAEPWRDLSFNWKRPARSGVEGTRGSSQTLTLLVLFTYQYWWATRVANKLSFSMPAEKRPVPTGSAVDA